MEEKKQNRIALTKALLGCQEALINTIDQLNALKTLLGNTLEANPLLFDELRSVKEESATLESENDLEINTRDNLEDFIESKAESPIPPNPSCHEKNVSSDDESVIQLPNIIAARDKAKLKRESRPPTIFTRIMDVLDFQDVENDEVTNSVEKTRSWMAMNKLLTTEETYVISLEEILMYKTELEATLPPDIKDQVIGGLFCNIEDIYEKQKKFLNILRLSKTETDVNTAFILMKSMFDLYVPYARNRRKSDETYNTFHKIIKNAQKKLKNPLDLSCYLLNPVQRLCHYVLLLGEIEKDLTKRKLDSRHIHSTKVKIKNIMRQINNLLPMDKIKNVPTNLNLIEEGNFILEESFKLRKPFTLDVIVFLFQNVMVITIPANNQRSECLYVKHLNLDTIKLVPREEEPLILTLEKCNNMECYDKSMTTYEFEAKKAESKQHWEKILRKVLWKQFAAVKASGML